MAGENTVSTSDGLAKEVYGSKLNEVVPTSAVLFDLISFDEDNKTGDSYHQPVSLTFENGFTYNGSGGTVATLNAAVNATIKDASVSGVEMIGRTRMAYTLASRAAAGGKQAFAKAWTTILMNLRRASVKRLELQLLYGRLGLGIVESNTSGALLITAASWSPTTWAGLEGAVLEAWTGTTASETQHNGDLTISTVNRSTRTVTVTGTNSAVVANDVLYFKGARTASAYNEMVGLIQMAQSVSSGTLHGITQTDYALWNGNTKSSFTTPSMGKFLDAVTDMVDAGLEEGVELGVCPRTWEVLNADLAAQRDFDGSYSKEKAENGAQKIVYYGQNGSITVHSMPYLRRGDAVIFPKSKFKRIGSAELGMGVPGTDGRDVFFHLEDKNAVEARTFTDQALFCEAPAQCAYITGITYPS